MCKCANVGASVCVSVRTRVEVRVHVWKCAYTCGSVQMSGQVCVCMWLCVQMWGAICVQVCVCVCVQVCVCVCVQVCDRLIYSCNLISDTVQYSTLQALFINHLPVVIYSHYILYKVPIFRLVPYPLMPYTPNNCLRCQSYTCYTVSLYW